MEMFKLLFHVTVLSINSYTMWFDQKFVEVPFSRAKAFLHLPLKGRSTFFTTWSFIIQTAYFAVAIANDMFGTDEAFPAEPHPIRSIRDILFSSFAVPTAMYTTTVFWLIYAINRELIMPRKTDKVIPGWLNHVLHTSVMPVILLEMIISQHDYPSRSLGLLLVVNICNFYFLWKMYVYYETRTWVYPLFDVLNWPLRACYCIGTSALSVVLYCIGEKLNSTLWLSHTKIA